MVIISVSETILKYVMNKKNFDLYIIKNFDSRIDIISIS